MSITIILTAFQESQTVGKAINALLPQMPAGAEMLVVCPDVETTAVIQQYAQTYPQIHHIADQRRGKPAALNLGIAAAKHPLLVFTDGDIVVGEQALSHLLAPFSDPQVGAVTGRPLTVSPRQTMLGYWSHLLVHAAHLERTRRQQIGDFLLCSGYLFAARKTLVGTIPEDALAEDAVISHRIAEQGLHIHYAPEAEVFVKYPDNWADWLKQKVRSAGGYTQSYIRNSPFQMRSARLEAVRGAQMAFQFAQTPREFVWTILLFKARLYLWLLIFWRVRVQKRPLSQLWQPVQSTK
jgi:cellulose synthase/poly-beta-1,6-N-acetylglucosamine synthase-like glycosyltransferase